MMSSLNLPPCELRIKSENGKDYVLDPLRKQYVRFTPEENVRQHFIHFLMKQKGFPEGLLANEVGIELNNIRKRCDTVLYNKYLQPVVLIEYKAPSIRITQETFDQILRYNMKLHVPWLIVSNGINHFCCKINFTDESYRFEKEIPDYKQLEI